MKLGRVVSFFCLFLCAFLCAGCSKVYVGYAKSEFEPKTHINSGYGKDYNRWISNDVNLVNSYADYLEYEIDLGYTEDYFLESQLLILLKKGCSTDNLEFSKVLEKDSVLYPVVKINPYYEGDYATMDIIFYVFYAEIPASTNYSVGEVIMETRPHKVLK